MASAHTPVRAAAAPGGWARLRKNRTALWSLYFLIAMTLACFFVPLLMHEGRSEPSANAFAKPGQVGTVTEKKGKEAKITYFWGGDLNGRDICYRVLTGGRISLIIALCAAALSLFVGTIVGLVSGYLGGWVDSIIMRIVDVLYAIPRLLFVLVVVAALKQPLGQWLSGLMVEFGKSGNEWMRKVCADLIPMSSILLMILTLGLIEWLTMARVVRGQVLVLKEQQFIAAARAIGRGPWGIMRKHLLPNLWTVILTYLTLTVPVVILDESFLSFLGLGIDEPATTWGALLKDGGSSINPLEFRWWLLVFPAVFLSTTLLALNFLGDGLRDAFDVK